MGDEEWRRGSGQNENGQQSVTGCGRFHCLPAPLRGYNFAAPSSIASNFLIRSSQNMKSSRVTSGMDRRHFLTATGGGLIAAAVPSAGDAAGFVTGKTAGTASRSAVGSAAPDPSSMRKIPIGVF